MAIKIPSHSELKQKLAKLDRVDDWDKEIALAYAQCVRIGCPFCKRTSGLSGTRSVIHRKPDIKLKHLVCDRCGDLSPDPKQVISYILSLHEIIKAKLYIVTISTQRATAGIKSLANAGYEDKTWDADSYMVYVSESHIFDADEMPVNDMTNL